MTSTVVVSIGAVTLALLILGAGGAALLVFLRRELAPPSGGQVALSERVAELEVIVRGLPSLWEEERERAQRHANTAKTARRESEKKLAEVEELIEQNAGVPVGDGSEREQIEMSEMRPSLGLPREADYQARVSRVAHLLR